MMKTRSLYLILTAFPSLTMCHNGDSKKTADHDLAGSRIVSSCYYRAVDNKDTAFLDLLDYGKGKVKGHLLIRYTSKPNNEGRFTGYHKGDTLFLNYHFYIGADSSRRFANPLAMLKKQDSLILGVGTIVTHMGKSYFDKNVPVNFEKGRFRFSLVKCN